MAVEPVTIYALADPGGAIRYVGQTAYAPEQRLKQHIALLSVDQTCRGAWLRERREQGIMPEVRVLEVTDSKHANERERHHVAACRAQGCDLVNDDLPRDHTRLHRSRAGWVQRSTRLPPEIDRAVMALAKRLDVPVTETIYPLIREALAARAAPVPAAPAPTQEERP